MHHVIFHKLIQSEGLTLGIGKDVMTEVVAPGQIPMMIEYDSEGIIAGYIVAEPFGTIVVNAGLGEVLRLSKDIMPSHPCCAIIARDEIIEKYPEAVQELVNSFVQSGLSVKTNIDETVKTAVSFLNQKEEIIRSILEDPRERVSTDKLMPVLKEFDDIQNYLIDTVSVPSISGKIDLEKFVDLRFAAAAGAK
jgi:NitT/TauT family transport system substrate-binding protein